MHVSGYNLAPSLWLSLFVMLAGCATDGPAVVQTLDERTAVTITSSGTALIMSPDVTYANANAREYVQFGALEINRMGAREYFVWLGIWDIDYLESGDEFPVSYESITVLADGVEIPLQVHGWTHESIGASAGVYKKIFAEDADAYYRVGMPQIGQLSMAKDIVVRTTADVPKEFVPWYKQERASAALQEFYRVVSQ